MPTSTALLLSPWAFLLLNLMSSGGQHEHEIFSQLLSRRLHIIVQKGGNSYDWFSNGRYFEISLPLTSRISEYVLRFSNPPLIVTPAVRWIIAPRLLEDSGLKYPHL